MKRSNRIVFLGVILLEFASLVHVARAGSCGSAKLCCQGRDSGCVIQKDSPNAVVFSPRDKPCYCDHACLKLGDCCDDFKDTCGVVDCVVSEWSLWTPCDNGCGPGTQKRTRVIEVPEKNGGKHCPRLDQVRNCRSHHDCHQSVYTKLHDKSITIFALVPDPNNDTHSWSYRGPNDISPRCVAFTIVRASQACSKVSIMLSEGSRICTERQENGILEKLVGIGHWQLAGTPDVSVSNCHGKWIGDGRIPVDCTAEKCKHAVQVQHVAAEYTRSKRSILMGTAARTARIMSKAGGRTVRRRRRGRRRKDSQKKQGQIEYQ